MVKKTGIFILLIIMIFFSTACDPVRPYLGGQPWYVAGAIYSIPGTASYEGDQYLCLGRDEYGREMYAAIVCGGWLLKDSVQEGVLALVILQGYDESEVWFYREQNYLATSVPDHTAVTLTEELVYQHFAPEQIDALKMGNDWGCEISNDRSLHVPLELQKALRDNRYMRRQAEEQIGDNLRFQFFRETSDGTQVFFIMDIDNARSVYTWYLAAYDKDGVLIPDSVVRIPKNMDSLASNVDAYWQEHIESTELRVA